MAVDKARTPRRCTRPRTCGLAPWGQVPAAGLPVIKFHAARHTAATLALEAGTDIRIVSKMLGHSTTGVTQDLYQHVRVQLQIDAAETAVELLSGRKGVRETGS